MTIATNRQGTVDTVDLDEHLTLHTYTAPADGFEVNTTVFELVDRLIVVDAQLLRTFTEEAADLVEALDKPVDRFIVTHNHGDHYSGLATLTQRFPGVQVAALPALREWLAAYGEEALRTRREMFGDQIGARAVVPDAVLIPGELTIAGVRFVFGEVRDAESEVALTIALPDHRVFAVFDLLSRPDRHLFTTRLNFDRWIAVLQQFRREVAEEGYTRMVIGHGPPVGPDVIPAAIAYLHEAREAFEVSATREQYKEEIARRMPDRGPATWLDWSSVQAFGIVPK